MMSSVPISSTSRVPNIFPTETAKYRIAIIGEAPGELEDAYGRPFVGPAGKMLDQGYLQGSRGEWSIAKQVLRP